MSQSIPNLIQTLYRTQSHDFSAPHTNNETNENTNKPPSTPQASSRSSETHLSLRSQKLSSISKEFFNGPISSENISALTQSLYENGFLNSDQFQAASGTPVETNSINQAKHFVNSFMLEASKQHDSQTLAMLDPVILALTNMDSASSQSQRQNEIIALDNANQILTRLQSMGADNALIAEFENAVDVLSTLETLRRNDQLNPDISKYEAIQSELNDANNPQPAE